MSCRTLPSIFALLALVVVLGQLLGCSIVLAPSRRHGDGQDASADAAASDGGIRDTGTDAGSMPDAGPMPDAWTPDAWMPDAALPVDVGVDAHVIDAASPDAGPECGALECSAAAPASWNGPIVLVRQAGDTAPACPSGTTSAFATHTSLSASPAGCTCGCGAPSALGSCSGTVEIRSNTTCTTGLGSVRVGDATPSCNTLSRSGSYWSVVPPPYTPAPGATCTPVPSVSVPPATWGESLRGCGFGSPASCGTDGVCTPMLGAGQQLCVWSTTTTTCPGAYPNRVDASDAFSDDRGCAPCTCGTPTGSCTGSVDLSQSCTGILYGGINVGACGPIPPGTGVIGATSYVTPSAVCPPSAPSPTGSATPTGTRTICCR